MTSPRASAADAAACSACGVSATGAAGVTDCAPNGVPPASVVPAASTAALVFASKAAPSCGFEQAREQKRHNCPQRASKMTEFSHEIQHLALQHAAVSGTAKTDYIPNTGITQKSWPMPMPIAWAEWP
jgi:hypothetical protein